MNDAGHEHRHIMFMTGHKNETSIRRYNRHCSVQRKIICQQVPPRTLFHLVYFFVVFRGLSSRIHHLQHRHENQKNSGLIDGETLDLVIQNVKESKIYGR
jgi:hypothetical protein